MDKVDGDNMPNPSMSDARAFHVDGPCLLKVGATWIGDGTSLYDLGISEDGVDGEITSYWEPIKSDAAGPRVPADMQDMGQDATIRFLLTDYPEDLFRRLAHRLGATSPSDGVQGPRGRIAGASGDTFRLVMSSPRGTPFRFLTCLLQGPQGWKSSSQNTKQRCTVYAWALVGAGSNDAKDKVLYDHTVA